MFSTKNHVCGRKVTSKVFICKEENRLFFVLLIEKNEREIYKICDKEVRISESLCLIFKIGKK